MLIRTQVVVDLWWWPSNCNGKGGGKKENRKEDRKREKVVERKECGRPESGKSSEKYVSKADGRQRASGCLRVRNWEFGSPN